MDDFEREIGEAFSEVSETAMPVRFRLNNDLHYGVIQSTVSADHLREPGYESENAIVAVVPRAQFNRPPDEYVRQRLSVANGPFKGDYSVQKANADAAHYSLTAIPVEG